MSRIFFTSDTHFGHKNILHLCDRPYRDITENNEALVENWNKVVSPDDEVYHLGDFGLGSTKYLTTFMRRLNGRKHLVRGNHDKAIKNEALKFWETDDPYLELNVNKKLIVLCHYPFLSWKGMHRGSYHLHGHVHSRCNLDTNFRYDVGVDANGYIPVSLDQIFSTMEKRKVEL